MHVQVLPPLRFALAVLGKLQLVAGITTNFILPLTDDSVSLSSAITLVLPVLLPANESAKLRCNVLPCLGTDVQLEQRRSQYVRGRAWQQLFGPQLHVPVAANTAANDNNDGRWARGRSFPFCRLTLSSVKSR